MGGTVRSRSGSAITSMPVMGSSANAKRSARASRPPAPAPAPPPSTSAGRLDRTRSEASSAPLATFRGPRRTTGAGVGPTAGSARRTTSGSSSATSASKSPPREAAKNASTTLRWRARSGSRRRAAPAHPPPGPAGELAGGGRGALDHRRDLVERHGEHVVQHERQPLGRGERVQHDQQRQPDRVGEQRLLLGVAGRSAVTIGSGTWHVERLLAAVSRRDRSMFRHTRATTVVSQPPRFSTSSASGAAEPQPGLLHGVVGLARASRASGRPPPAGGAGAPRSARPASRVRPSVTFLSLGGVIAGRPPDAAM